MTNVFFELDRLRVVLIDKGVELEIIDRIVSKANDEISSLVTSRGQQAIDAAVDVGADKGSADFINQLYLDTASFEVKTESGELDFSEPPRPMLPFLLKNAKISKDGTAYKVIPVGKPGNKPPISNSIIDVQKKISVQRKEEAKTRAKAIAPAGSPINFKTVTSRQEATKQWVQPAKDMDFKDDIKHINDDMQESLSDSIRDIIEGYIGLY